MAEIKKYEPGQFCWAELATSDTHKAKAFYSEVLGWKMDDMPAGPDMIYTMCIVGGKRAAAMYHEKQTPPHWNIYVAVASADETAEKAKALGGTIEAPPFDVLDVGRMTVIQGPEGAFINAWQAKKHIGASVMNENGALVWFDLMANDTLAAEKFYARLFGWTVNKGSDYSEWHLGGKGIGGMLPIPFATKEASGIPSFWYPYFQTDDVDRTTARVTQQGGKVHKGPTDVPKVGRFSVVKDPAGAIFALFKQA